MLHDESIRHSTTESSGSGIPVSPGLHEADERELSGLSNGSSHVSPSESEVGHAETVQVETMKVDSAELGSEQDADNAMEIIAELDDDSWADEELFEDEQESWFGHDSFAVAASLLGHMVVVLLLALVPLAVEMDSESVVLISSPPEYEDESLQEIEEIVYSDLAQTEVGANSLADTAMAEASAPEFAEVAEIPNPVDQVPQELATLNMNNMFSEPVAPLNLDIAVKGKVGQAAEGATGAVDRLTFEIVKSLEERPTLLVWIFDQSGSLVRQRAEIKDRFDRIYEELGIVQESGDEAFRQRGDEPPLLTSIMGFGQTVNLMTAKPLSDLDEIKSTVDGIENDPSGVENVFSAVYKAADRYKTYRRKSTSRGGERNVMLVVVTDERGDDTAGMEPTIDVCQKYGMPVYVIGVPAPFGQEHTLIKYVDPDPQYDQTPRFAQVDQGPESLFPEAVNIGVLGNSQPAPVVDSGFGPFALTRLAYETGGIFFTVHPNRDVNRRVSTRELSPFASRIDYFVDPNIMSRYRPDYVSPKDYEQRVRNSPLRAALVQAARMGKIETLEDPTRRFVKQNEAQLATSLTRAQQPAALVFDKLLAVDTVLRSGERGREAEDSPRWLAGFDLARGRVLAHKVRAETYNAILAKAKLGLPFEDPKNNTWVLKASEEISVGSKLEREAKEAIELLTAVVQNHPGTPWAVLAEQELKTPIGWKWTEEYTDLAPPPTPGPGNNNNNPAPPRDDMVRMLDRKPVRDIPKL